MNHSVSKQSHGRVVKLFGGLTAIFMAGCTSFGSAADAPADAGPISDAAADAADVLVTPGDTPPPGAPGAPAGVAPAAISVVTAVTTLAGLGTAGFVDGAGVNAAFNYPQGLAADAAGNLYVADTVNNRVRKVTPAGVVTTLAGSGTAAYVDASGAGASFSAPIGVAVDATGNLYVADNDNNCIRKVTPAGVVTTLAGLGVAGGNYADGVATVARFNVPTGLAIDSAGKLSVTDLGNVRIRQVTPAGFVTTLAGSGGDAFADGTGVAASFAAPLGVAADGAGTIYVADTNNRRVRKVTSAGVVTTLAGSGSAAFADGVGPTASFRGPTGAAVDRAGNVYVADVTRIRRVTPAGSVTTLAGSELAAFADGAGPAARFGGGPMAIAVDAAANVYVADVQSHRIRKLVSIGIGQLSVTWNAPSSTGASAITDYTASARATGQPSKTCTTSGATSCTIVGLTSGVAYSVSVTASNREGSSAPSGPISATPN